MAKKRRWGCREETKETNRLLSITEMMEEMVSWMREENKWRRKEREEGVCEGTRGRRKRWKRWI